jgi:hypothetical protein
VTTSFTRYHPCVLRDACIMMRSRSPDISRDDGSRRVEVVITIRTHDAGGPEVVALWSKTVLATWLCGVHVLFGKVRHKRVVKPSCYTCHAAVDVWARSPQLPRLGCRQDLHSTIKCQTGILLPLLYMSRSRMIDPGRT